MNVALQTRRWSARILMCLAIVPAFCMVPTTSFAATDHATLQIGRLNVGPCFRLTGYHGPLSMGSYSPTGLTGGRNVGSLFEAVTCGTPNPSSTINVTGFSSNPGSAWLTSLTCNGITKSAAGATFQYLFGTASWNFSGSFGFQSLPTGTSVSCEVVHN